jgi:leucyl-tRNA synthetase
MSKSKGNVVDPDYLIQRFGADTARLFCLFAAPPEKDLDWSDKGVEGSFRFLQRLWRIVMERADELSKAMPTITTSSQNKETVRFLHVVHKTIKKVTDDLARFHLNTAIAATMELVNGINKYLETEKTDKESINVLRGAVDTLIILVSPFCPHITQELWQVLGHDDLVLNCSWPSYNEAYVQEDSVTVAIQVNGKLRDTVEVDRDMDQEELKNLILSLEKIQRHLPSAPIKKVIVVPNKLVNIVA